MEANQEARSANAETRETALKTVCIARVKRALAQETYFEALWRAHNAGCTVSELAGALGISRTAVYKQLGRKKAR